MARTRKQITAKTTERHSSGRDRAWLNGRRATSPATWPSPGIRGRQLTRPGWFSRSLLLERPGSSRVERLRQAHCRILAIQDQFFGASSGLRKRVRTIATNHAMARVITGERRAQGRAEILGSQ